MKRSIMPSSTATAAKSSDLEFKFKSHKIAAQGIANTATASTATDKPDTMAKSNKRSSSKRSINTSVRRMDQVASSSTKKEADIRADHLLEESKAIRRFAKLLGALCVLLVFMVFGVDLALLEDLTALVVHNVVAAVILICGLNVATVIYESIATPVPGSPQDSSPSTPLQGLIMRRPSHSAVVPLQQPRRSKRPDSIVVSVPQKRNSGGLFSGLWPRRKKRASKDKNYQEQQQQQQQQQPYKSRQQSKKISLGRRRGWPTERLSATGSL